MVQKGWRRTQPSEANSASSTPDRSHDEPHALRLSMRAGLLRNSIVLGHERTLVAGSMQGAR